MTKAPSLCLVGTGHMAINYAKVLTDLKVSFTVIGRGKISAKSFTISTGCKVTTGGIKKYKPPYSAIVAVGIKDLIKVSKYLINNGTKRILLEKPGGINLNELKSLQSLAKKKKTKIFIAYNRRFYHSVEIMKKLIKRDGGVRSMIFDFTEWSNRISKLKKDNKIKENWFLSNSTHVVDLAFHLCGKPKTWKFWHKGGLHWHSRSSSFCGAGITDKGIIFSYLSDWEAPGRWGLELMTKKNRFILKPMEELKVIKLDSVVVEKIKIKKKIDTNYKAGIFLQTKKFVNKQDLLFCSLAEQIKNVKIYLKMAGY
jgi:hypothetical protein